MSVNQTMAPDGDMQKLLTMVEAIRQPSEHLIKGVYS